MKLLPTVFLVALVAAAAKAQFYEWDHFKAHHQKIYESAEHESHRRAIFMKNLEIIRKHNFEADLNMHSWYMGVNQFGDMTDEEVTNTMTGLNNLPSDHDVNSTAIDYGDFKADESVNWVKKGYVNPIVSQGRCGSCYSFSAMATLEGQYKRVFKKLYKFSEQSVIDCSYRKAYEPYKRYPNPPTNKGCNGGIMSFCFECNKHCKGAMLQKDYKYKGRVGKCRFDRRKAKHFRIGSIRSKRSPSENELKKACAKNGPISVAINASAPGFRNYKRGVFSVKGCSKRCNHAINIVGYGKDKRHGDYWLIRNSWATYWGDRGYMKLARNKRCMCGICDRYDYPELKK